MLDLMLRKRVPSEALADGWRVTQQPTAWDPTRTAAVICDMWDQHWCRGASERVKEIVPRMNLLAAELRRRGVLIIHAPSETLDFYRGHPAIALAQSAPPVQTDVPLENWKHLDPAREGQLPIDDSDGGCDCQPTCVLAYPWRRQIEALDILDGDAISDGFEAYYLIRKRSIQNVLIMGVHVNMCVLGRPFGIRQLAGQGLNVALVRDLTDSMYNSRMPPKVDHFSGTDLIIEHIEKHWCPSITSDQINGGSPFRFANDHRYDPTN
jgi:nicotinamidase-related amidase